MEFTNAEVNIEVLKQRAYNMRWAEVPEGVIPLTAADSDFPAAPEIGQALNDYAQKRFHMFDGETVSVKMRFHKSLVNVVMDRFGSGTMLFPDGEDHFVFTVDVAESPQFYSWVIGFGSRSHGGPHVVDVPDAQILHPARIRKACLGLCREVLAQYTECMPTTTTGSSE